MSSTLEHFSHSNHLLSLQEEESTDVLRKYATCRVCDKAITGSPTYTCTSDDIDCQSFYLHKSCAELHTQIHHHKHNKHLLALLPRPNDYSCDVCGHGVTFAYACNECDFDVCVICAFAQRVLCHPGHDEHTLTLMQRESLFMCDACGVKSEDSSYVCITCDFCIHKRCASSPSTITTPTYHHSSTREYSTVKYVKNKLTIIISCCSIIVVNVIILFTMIAFVVGSKHQVRRDS